jgi:hypothetical protein
MPVATRQVREAAAGIKLSPFLLGITPMRYRFIESPLREMASPSPGAAAKLASGYQLARVFSALPIAKWGVSASEETA